MFRCLIVKIVITYLFLTLFQFASYAQTCAESERNNPFNPKLLHAEDLIYMQDDCFFEQREIYTNKSEEWVDGFCSCLIDLKTDHYQATKSEPLSTKEVSSCSELIDWVEGNTIRSSKVSEVDFRFFHPGTHLWSSILLETEKNGLPVDKVLCLFNKVIAFPSKSEEEYLYLLIDKKIDISGDMYLSRFLDENNNYRDCNW